MGKCDVCGRENGDFAVECLVCGERLVAGDPPAPWSGFFTRCASLFGTYWVCTSVGVFIGSLLVEGQVRGNDIIGAIMFAPMLNAIPIIAGAADSIFPLTILCWFLFPVGVITYHRSGAAWSLGLVAAVSVVMNLSTLIRLLCVMSM